MIEKLYFEIRTRKESETIEKEFDGLRTKLTLSDPDCAAMRKKMDEVGNKNKPLDLTNLWYWLKEEGDIAHDPRVWFYGDPPISHARLSNRILFTGTSSQLRHLCKSMIEAGYKRVSNKVQIGNGPGSDVMLSMFQAILAHINIPDVENFHSEFCSHVGDFWSQFFDQDKFMDNIDQVSIPCIIVGTGSMRNYNYIGGETLCVRNRLIEIANMWQIPCYFLPSID